MVVDRENLACGVVLIAFGAIFSWQSLEVGLGTWRSIGAGGMPFVLSLTLIALGAVILFQGLRVASSEGHGVIAWRGMVFILLAPIVFGLLIRGLGFVGTVFVTGLFASFASSRMTPQMALGLAVSLTIFATLVFSYGLSLPFERVGPWLRF